MGVSKLRIQVYDKNTIENIIKVFADKTIAAAYGRQVPYSNASLFARHLRKFNYPNQSYTRSAEDISRYGIKTIQLSNSFAAYRKKVLLEIGNFKKDIILGEDVYAGAKIIEAGYHLAYVAKAKVYHSHNYTIREEMKRYFDIGVFHKIEHWILKRYGKAEGEGFRYIKSELKYMIEEKKLYQLPEFIIRSGFKYFGYFMGKQYRVLPIFLKKKMSMNSGWWRISKLNL